jgi:hypothetical protein
MKTKNNLNKQKNFVSPSPIHTKRNMNTTTLVTNINEVAKNCVITLARVIVLMGALAFAMILCLEWYLRIQDITKQYREHTHNHPVTIPGAATPSPPPYRCSCSCSCNLSQNNNNTTPTTNEEKEQ